MCDSICESLVLCGSTCKGENGEVQLKYAGPCQLLQRHQVGDKPLMIQIQACTVLYCTVLCFQVCHLMLPQFKITFSLYSFSYFLL